MVSSLTIVHANSLVEASYSLNITEMRILALASTKVDSKTKSIGEIRINVSEYNKTYEITHKRSYGDLRDAVKSIMRKPVKFYEGSKVKELSWLVMNEYDLDEKGSHVLLEFSPKIEPYLFELKERFTQINFKYASKLNTSFSFRLYQWLKKIEHLNKHKDGLAISNTLDIEWMKQQAQLIGQYDRWGNFNDFVIKPAIDKINANTDISVFYEPVKSGRKVTAVKFSYVVEKDESCIKPLRPRLFRRPKVVKGSHEEGVWMRKNLALLLEYEVQLKQYDNKAKLALADLRKIADYASICDKITEDRVRNEIALRTKK